MPAQVSGELSEEHGDELVAAGEKPRVELDDVYRGRLISTFAKHLLHHVQDARLTAAPRSDEGNDRTSVVWKQLDLTGKSPRKSVASEAVLASAEGGRITVEDDVRHGREFDALSAS